MPIINKGKWGKYRVKDNRNLFFYPEEWIKLMEKAKVKQRITFDIILNTGARFDEAKHIKVEDLDFNRNNITLKVTKVKSKLKQKKPIPRIVPISSQFAKRLRKDIKNYRLLQNDYLPMIRNQAANTAIKKLAKLIGRNEWRDFSSHNIRKTYESWLLACNINEIKVMKIMGHTLSVAAQHYVSSDIFSFEDKRLIHRTLGDLIDRLRGDV